mgnify:CR=1 FL=1
MVCGGVDPINFLVCGSSNAPSLFLLYRLFFCLVGASCMLVFLDSGPKLA